MVCERIQGMCTWCGRRVTKVVDGDGDGVRFVDSGVEDTGWCLFRCSVCLGLIRDTWIAGTDWDVDLRTPRGLAGAGPSSPLAAITRPAPASRSLLSRAWARFVG